jgi:hypothetical protein
MNRKNYLSGAWQRHLIMKNKMFFDKLKN